MLSQQRFSDDGKTYGTGSLWMLSPAATFVGLYVNKDVLDQLGLVTDGPPNSRHRRRPPRTWSYGDSAGVQEGWPAIHMFTSFQNVTVPTEQLLDIVFHTNPASFDTPENVEAATIAERFGSDGFYSDGYLGKTAQTAIDNFNAGQALYFLQGTYFSGGIVEALGDKVEMALVPGAPDGPFSVTGGPGLGLGELVEVGKSRRGGVLHRLAHGPSGVRAVRGRGRSPGDAVRLPGRQRVHEVRLRRLGRCGRARRGRAVHRLRRDQPHRHPDRALPGARRGPNRPPSSSPRTSRPSTSSSSPRPGPAWLGARASTGVRRDRRATSGASVAPR